MSSGSSHCAACGGSDLRPHLAVAGEMGPRGLIPTTDRFGTALADIFRCATCGHMQLDPMPDEAVLGAAYAQAESDDYIREEPGQRQNARLALERIASYSGAPGRLVDLGCWVGALLVEAKQRGWQPVGVEPSDFASEYARQHYSLNVLTADVLTAPLPPSSFDAVTMGDVIEHLAAPGAALDRIRELLTPGGILWLALPDAGSLAARAFGRRWWSVIPTHVQYFTRQSMRVLLDRHGFDVLEARTAPKAFTVGYYLGRLSGYSPPVAEALTSVADRARLADRIWTLDLHDRMGIVARVRSPALHGATAASILATTR